MSNPGLGMLIADDHQESRSALSALLRQNHPSLAIREAGSLSELQCALAGDGSIGLVAASLQMAGISGLRHFRRTRPDIHMVATAPTADRDMIFEVLETGVHGFVALDAPAEETLAAFRMIAAGQIYVPPQVCELSPERLREEASIRRAGQIHLTSRQKEVLALLERGKSNKEMSRVLRIAESTVKVHLAAAYRTLGVFNRLGAVAAFAGLKSDLFTADPLLPGLYREPRRGRRRAEIRPQAAIN